MNGFLLQVRSKVSVLVFKVSHAKLFETRPAIATHKKHEEIRVVVVDLKMNISRQREKKKRKREENGKGMDKV